MSIPDTKQSPGNDCTIIQPEQKQNHTSYWRHGLVFMLISTAGALVRVHQAVEMHVEFLRAHTGMDIVHRKSHAETYL